MGDEPDSVDLADLFGLDGARIHVGRPLGSASQGRLYQVDGVPGTAAKLFAPAHLSRSASELRFKLTWMIDHPPVTGPAVAAPAPPGPAAAAAAADPLSAEASGGAVLGGGVSGGEASGDAGPGDAGPGGAVFGGEASGSAVPGGRVSGGPVSGGPVSGGPAAGGAVSAGPPPAGSALADGRDVLAWPRGLVLDGRGDLVGYTLTAPPDDGVPLSTLADQTAPDRPTWADDWGVRLRAAVRLAAAIAVLHERGYVVGDFHDDAIRITAAGDVTLVDLDAAQVTTDAGAHLAPVGRPDFTPAELLAQRGRPLTAAADQYALAVHLFGLLMGGHRPYTGRWRGDGPAPGQLELARRGLFALGGHRDLGPPLDLPPADILPPGPRAMFGQAFGPGAGSQHPRPTAAQWHDALGALVAGLRACPRVATHHFRSGLPYCPWCVLDEQTGRRVPHAAPVTPPSTLPTAPWLALAPGTSVVSAPPARPEVPATAVTAAGSIAGGAAASAGTATPVGPRRTARVAPAPEPFGPTPAQPPIRDLPGPRRRPRPGDRRSRPRRIAARFGTALLCLLGAALVVFTVLGTAGELPEGDLGAADNGGSGVAATDLPPAASSGATAVTRAGRWPWVGRWRANEDAPRSGFGLRIVDDGPVDGEERFTATETSGSCPVHYRGTAATWLDDSGPAYPHDVYGLLLDAQLPAGADPAGCTLLRDRVFYGPGSAEPTSRGTIRIEVTGSAGDAARARVMVRPGDALTVILHRE